MDQIRTAAITGTGSALPKRIISNHDLEQILDTSDSWIRERTGISQRHLSDGEAVADLASEAAEMALKDAGREANEIDLILAATASADYIFPNLSCLIQAKIGAKNAACFDINVACTGFITALSTAWTYIRCGMAKKVLIVGAEAMSHLVNWKDRSTCILFGDGAGAVVLEAAEEGMEDVLLGADGAAGQSLTCRTRIASHPFCETKDAKQEGEDCDCDLHMDGQAVYQFAVTTVPRIIRQLLAQNQMEKEQVSCYLLHQANERIIRSAAKRLGEPMEKFPMNVQQTGNLSAASVPVLMDQCRRSGQLKKGDRIVLAGFGAGLTYGAALLTWMIE
ncbi:MAG: ketoacyl-ACP synthase III [Lachnospiraceae bacterium]|nr:ketoacyl-ACP synthase III [Lachnospiraceae bacterium]